LTPLRRFFPLNLPERHVAVAKFARRPKNLAILGSFERILFGLREIRTLARVTVGVDRKDSGRRVEH
jgi:hypothetical protein